MHRFDGYHAFPFSLSLSFSCAHALVLYIELKFAQPDAGAEEEKKEEICVYCRVRSQKGKACSLCASETTAWTSIVCVCEREMKWRQLKKTPSVCKTNCEQCRDEPHIRMNCLESRVNEIYALTCPPRCLSAIEKSPRCTDDKRRVDTD